MPQNLCCCTTTTSGKMAENTKDTVVFAGGIFRDLVAFADDFPRPGETIFGHDFLASFGGKAANQSVACANLREDASEFRVAFVGAVGRDENGRAYKEALMEKGVDVAGLAEMEGQHTGVACITVKADSGENQIVVVKGASEAVGPREVGAADFTRAALVVCALEMNAEAVLEALRRAKEVGAVTVLNAAPAPAAPRLPPHSDILSLSDVVCVNETEAETILSGLGESDAKVETIEQAKVSCAALMDRLACQAVVVTLGSRGAVFSTSSSRVPTYVKAPSIDPLEVVDTTGAGDAFVGALAYFMHSMPQLDMAEVVRRSCVVASHSVKSAGTQQSYPTRKQLPINLFD